MSFGPSFQGMAGMFELGFGIEALLKKKRITGYTPLSGAATVSGDEPITIWGVWAAAPDTPIQGGQTLAPTRSKSRDFIIPAKDLPFEPKSGDELTIAGEKFEISFVRSVRDGDTVISYRFELERA